MPRLRTFEDFVELLKQNHIPHSADPASLIVELPSQATPLPGNLYVKWSRNVPFVQLIHFMIDAVPDERVPALEAVITRLNHGHDIAGFGFDDQHHRLYYRVTLPVFPDDGIHPGTLNSMCRTVTTAARQFVEPLQMVVDGRPAEDLQAILAEVTAKRKAAAP